MSLLYNFKKNWEMFSNFVTYSEYTNFINSMRPLIVNKANQPIIEEFRNYQNTYSYIAYAIISSQGNNWDGLHDLMYYICDIVLTEF